MCPVNVTPPFNVIPPEPDVKFTALAPVLLPTFTVLATAPVPIFILFDAVVFVAIFIAPEDVF